MALLPGDNPTDAHCEATTAIQGLGARSANRCHAADGARFLAAVGGGKPSLYGCETLGLCTRIRLWTGNCHGRARSGIGLICLGWENACPQAGRARTCCARRASIAQRAPKERRMPRGREQRSVGIRAHYPVEIAVHRKGLFGRERLSPVDVSQGMKRV